MSWDYYPDGKLKSRADDGVPVGEHVVLVDNSDTGNVTATGTWAASSTGDRQPRGRLPHPCGRHRHRHLHVDS